MTPTHVCVCMSDREASNTPLSSDAHATAAAEFVNRVRSRFEREIIHLYVFGSTVRGETRGLASDIDILVVLKNNTNHNVLSEALRDLAYDILLEYGPVVELHIISEQEFKHAVDHGQPFIQNVVQEGRSYA